jgi:hypothetical protein
MHDRDSVETILARLMPPALSVSAQQDIEAMLDELAGPAAVNQPSARSWRRWIIGGGLAASLAAALAIPHLMKPATTPETVTATHLPEFLLVGESDRVQSMTDEGWREIPDGSAVRAMRVRVIEENSLFDEETGIVMQVSQPREELLLMPISTF